MTESQARNDELTSLGITRGKARWYYRDRWGEINRQDVQALRRQTPEESFRQFVSLLQTARVQGWCKRTEEDEEVRQRWIALKRRGF